MSKQAVYGQIAEYKEQLDEAQSRIEAEQQDAASKQAELEQLQAASASADAEHTTVLEALQRQLREQEAASRVSEVNECLNLFACPLYELSWTFSWAQQHMAAAGTANVTTMPFGKYTALHAGF